MSTKTLENSILNLCRTCMSKITSTRKAKGLIADISIYLNEKTTVSKKINDLLETLNPGIKFHEDSARMPNVICMACISKMRVAYSFTQLCKETDSNLRSLLNGGSVYSVESHQVGSVSQNAQMGQVEEQYLDFMETSVTEEEKIVPVPPKVEIEIEEINFSDDYEQAYDSDQALQDIEEEINNDAGVEKELKHNFNENNAVSNIFSGDEDEYAQEEETEIEDKKEFIYSDASDNEQEWIATGSQTNALATTIKKELPVKSEATSNPVKKKEKPNDDIIMRFLQEQLKERKDSKTKKPNKKSNPNKNEEPPLNVDGTVTCQKCNEILENSQEWHNHMTAQHLGKNKPLELICEYCNKVFTRTGMYNAHLRKHTGEKPFLCMECGKSFKHSSSLSTHMVRHKGDKNIQCPHCPKKFVCSSGLYGHMMVHNKDKRPYVCDLCGAAFHMAYQLRNHNKYHNNIRLHQCEYCERSFVTREKQLRHMRTHTGEKPYKCKYCERAFAQSNDCIKHSRQHVGDDIYLCDLCPKRFPLLKILRDHFATHKDDDEETKQRLLAERAESETALYAKLGL